MIGRISPPTGRPSWLWVLVVLGSTTAAPGCEFATAGAPAPATAQSAPSGSQWRAARRELARLRAVYAPRRPYTMNLALEMTHPLTGSRLRARGAVAVSPRDDGLRMILLGPGGTTALDLWICGEQFRISLPAAGLERRGDDRTPREELRGLPVDFLRWWLLRPFQGSLLHAADDGESRRFLLRDHDEIVDLTAAAAGTLSVERRSPWDRQSVVVDGPGCADLRYHQASTGIDIAIRCERLDPRREPRPEAFADPDAPDRACSDSAGAAT